MAIVEYDFNYFEPQLRVYAMRKNFTKEFSIAY